MQRKQDGGVPVAETLADLSGPVQAIRDASTQARHHFTQADQVREPKRKSRLRLQRCRQFLW